MGSQRRQSLSELRENAGVNHNLEGALGRVLDVSFGPGCFDPSGRRSAELTLHPTLLVLPGCEIHFPPPPPRMDSPRRCFGISEGQSG